MRSRKEAESEVAGSRDPSTANCEPSEKFVSYRGERESDIGKNDMAQHDMADMADMTVYKLTRQKATRRTVLSTKSIGFVFTASPSTRVFPNRKKY